jgi:predicted nuclease of predicted toxin-antitoxin system
VLRLYHDEDALQAALVSALRRAGFDCLTANEANMRGRTDQEQLAFATGARRVLYTKNTADFRRLDTQWRLAGRRHGGIIVVTDQRTPIGVQVKALQAMADRSAAEEMVDRLEFLLNYVRD